MGGARLETGPGPSDTKVGRPDPPREELARRSGPAIPWGFSLFIGVLGGILLSWAEIQPMTVQGLFT